MYIVIIMTEQNKTHIVRTFEYLKRASDTFLLVDYIEKASENESLQKQVLNKWMSGVSEMVRDKGLYVENLAADKIEEAAQHLEKEMAQGYKEQFDKLKITVLNMNLVMLCTVLEIFFEHVLKTIFDANPKILLKKGEKNINLKRFLELGSYEEVLNTFKEKLIDETIRGGTKEILNFFELIGINKKDLFLWEGDYGDDGCVQLQKWDDENLIFIFNKRHEIVHEAKSALIEVQELVLIKVFFDRVMINLSRCALKKFSQYNLRLDLQSMVIPEGAKEFLEIIDSK